MKKQAGFTLIELIMVIVILGILSAFALPRFADLSGNAESASLAGALASAKSTSSIVHASALANSSSGSVSLEGTEILIVNGYPDARGVGAADGTTVAAAAGLALAANIESDFGIIFGDGGTYAEPDIGDTDGLIVTISPILAGNPCFTYTEAGTNGSPAFSAIATLAGPTGTPDAYTC